MTAHTDDDKLRPQLLALGFSSDDADRGEREARRMARETELSYEATVRILLAGARAGSNPNPLPFV